METPLPTRILGKTGLHVPILGLGTAPGGSGLDDDVAIRLYEHAISSGITYIDTAPGYGRAQTQLAGVLEGKRERLIVATKAAVDGKDALLECLERNLRELQTDHVDIAYIHEVGNRDLDVLLSPVGSLAGLLEAKKRGIARFVGFTSHCGCWKSTRVIEREGIDVVMFAMNYVDRWTYGFEEAVLPQAMRRNIGVVGMKVFGGAHKMEYSVPTPSALESAGEKNLDLAFRYTAGLPGVASAVVGMYSIAEVDENVRIARDFQALTHDEERELLARGKPVAGTLGEHFGPAER